MFNLSPFFFLPSTQFIKSQFIQKQQNQSWHKCTENIFVTVLSYFVCSALIGAKLTSSRIPLYSGVSAGTLFVCMIALNIDYADLPAFVQFQVHPRVTVTVAVRGVVATAACVVTVTSLVGECRVKLLTEQGADSRPQLVNAASKTCVNKNVVQ